MASSGDLITKDYKNFRGVDFNTGEILPSRSSFSLNMWKNYKNNAKCVETRPLEVLETTFDNTIKSMYHYTINNVLHKITHCGTKLYDGTTQIYSGMNVVPAQYFIFNDILYIKDGINYLKYNGSTVSVVEGYIPITSMGKSPEGAGTTYQDVNLLTGKRKNSFVADGTSTRYQLDAENLDAGFAVYAEVNGFTITEGSGLSVARSTGIVTFDSPPDIPETEGQDNVIITFSKTIAGNRDKITHCTMLCEFDNRIFFSGYVNQPNMIWHSALENPEYVSDLDYYIEGDISPVKALVAGNNALWVFKEPNQSNTTIFYHNPVIDNTYGKIYPSVHSSISMGCVSTGINFNDDICFFSNRGLDGISSDITTEQVLGHRSTNIDNMLLKEPNYKNLILQEWQGYLLVCIDNAVYLADSRGKYQSSSGDIEYEWFYWQFTNNITAAYVKDDILYLGMDNKIYKLIGTEGTIESIWRFPKEDFNAPIYLKTTNKRGGTAVCEGDITIKTKTDNNDWETINTYEEEKGYIVYRIKKKKFKDIELEFSSTEPIKLYEATLQAFIGGYVKR